MLRMYGIFILEEDFQRVINTPGLCFVGFNRLRGLIGAAHEQRHEAH
jgi:hypothetical protein